MNIANIILVVASFLGSLLYYPRLPDLVPMHWNFQGNVDSYMPKQIAAFVMPVLALLIFLLYEMLPAFDPKKSNYRSFKKEWHTIQTAILGFLTYMQFLVFSIAVRPNIRLMPLMFFGMGILFIVIGNNLAKIKQNYFIGVRVPWTLANETNWNKTHRFARLTFMVVGVIILLEAVFLWQSPVIIFGSILLAVVIPALYSFLLFKKKLK